MTNIIQQQLKSLLQPLLDISLIIKGESTPETPYAELSTVAVTALGMSDEVSQGVDEQGYLTIRGQRRAEIAIHYFGADDGNHDVVEQLCKITDGLKRITVSEQFQLAQIGIEGSPELKTEMKEDAEWTPNSETYLSFFIHYSVIIKDAVSVIDNIHAASDGGEININLTR